MRADRLRPEGSGGRPAPKGWQMMKVQKDSALAVLRRGYALALSAAVSSLYAGAKLGDLGLTEDGFTYDFALPESVSIKELPKIEEAMRPWVAKLAGARPAPAGEAPEAFFAAQPYKKERLAGKPCAYYALEGFADALDAAQPADFRGLNSKAFRLTAVSGAYWNGDASGEMLTRLTGVAFASEKELAAYLRQQEEKEKIDHRSLGAQLDLFSSNPEIGQGLVLWHPKGAMVRYLLEKFSQQAHILNGYDWVYTPHIGRSELWKTSGHLGFYKDSMYAPILIDGEEYYLKPMNCPFHIAIYQSSKKSYRDLPVRYAEFGTVYRYELSGALQGLTRVRGFTQDDAHIICMPGQVQDEVLGALRFSLYILRAFGFEKFHAYISTRPEHKSIGDQADWDSATEALTRAVKEEGLPYDIDEGGGAFYGPKIDLKLLDAFGREWQCSTIQFDFNLPVRFHLEYTDSDGQPRTPVMVHRALFGSLERFFALLIEHYAGEFPLWLAPVQIGIVPIRESHNAYAKKLERTLRAKGLRVKADYNDEQMRSKIRRMEKEKYPVILVVGDKEVEDGGFAVRSRREIAGRPKGNLGFMKPEEFMELIAPELAKGVPQFLDED